MPRLENTPGSWTRQSDNETGLQREESLRGGGEVLLWGLFSVCLSREPGYIPVKDVADARTLTLSARSSGCALSTFDG